MGQMFPGLRGRAAAYSATEAKSVAFSRYYNDLARRGSLMGGGSLSRWPIERAVTEGYERVIWVFKSVNTISTDSSGLPFRLREGDSVVDDHPLYRVLNRKANQLESGQVFRKRLSAQVQLSKPGAFVQRVRSNAGTIKEVHLLPPDRMRIIPGLTTLIDHWEFQRRDGSVKNFEPDEVLWFRDPHPTDPYSGMTALEAAGMSVELDHFARLYNVAFMQNDGRPGGVLAVRGTGEGGDVPAEHMDRIEKRFGKGPVEAGKLSVVAGELSYIDLATRPRDMQYGQTSANSKMELLAAFGMSEVVLGNAAGRTFDNADAELYNYWSRTIPAHNRILLDGFDEDSGDDLVGFFDTSEIEVLERAAKARRDEARTEVAAGLRSIKSYADLAGYGEEVEDNVYTRSLYQPNGKTPLPTRPGDGALLGLDTAAPEQGAAAGDPAAAPEGPVDFAAMTQQAAAPGAPSAEGEPVIVQGVDMAALAAAPGVKHLRSVGGGARPKVAYSLSAKDGRGWGEFETDPEAQAETERALAAVLGALGERWIERAATRVASPKQRKGTRHWQAEYDQDTRVGTKALDADRSVDEETWQEEAEQASAPLIAEAAIAAALVAFANLDVTPPAGETLREMAVRVVRTSVASVIALVGISAITQARRIAKSIAEMDASGASIEDIRAMVRDQSARVSRWADGVAATAATATVTGGGDAAVEAAVEAEVDEDSLEIRREWISRRDGRVRETHRVADGQSRGLGEPFVVGGAQLRYPCDPAGPVHETANCRCRLRYRHRRSGRFMAPPA
jgi:HK97 family phage portal protein